MTEHELRCDVLVAGGGPAGVPCALAAARSGAKVILCQDRPMLGGNASSEIRMHIVGADGSGYRGVPLGTEAREGGIIEEIRLDLAVQNGQRSPSMLDLILYDKCRNEPNLTLLLNTAVVAAEVTDGTIRHAIAERQGTEDRFRIAADVFVDCTGDGRLGFEAGATARHGREGRAEFAESLAPQEGDRRTLGSTILFQARQHENPMPFVAPAWARKFTEDDLNLRPHAHPDVDSGLEYGYWWVEWGGCLDTIKDAEAIRDELLAIVMGIWDHIKNTGNHGADNWALEWFGFVPGKRESRRFVGQHILHEADLLESRPFDDAIAFGGWPIDIHPPEGVDAPNEPPCMQHHLPYLFDIPLRSCVSSNRKNLMFAGRNISATHVAFASTRVMATCAAVGQGVGTAAAHAARQKIAPADLAGDAAAMQTIQQQLLRDGCYLIGQANSDKQDLARQAVVRASSQQEHGPASAVIDGRTRSTHGDRGVMPGREAAVTHRWMSDPTDGLPAWLELAWPTTIRPRRIEITFDTGMHRVLTLSQSDAYVARMHWGRPQPETVRDYSIEFLSGEKVIASVETTGNYQRRRVHLGDVWPACNRVRINILATNGIDHARINEVRVYGE